MKLIDIKGIGAKSEALLNKLGIITIDDLLTYYPMRYEILKRSDLNNAEPEEKVIIDGKVDSIPLILRFNKGLNKMNFRLAIPNGVVGVSIFNRAFMKTHLTIGTSIIVIGKYDKVKNIVTASDIRFGSLSKEEKDLIFTIPHEKGIHVYIDNKEVKTYKKLNIFTAIDLSKVEDGDHKIRIIYKDNVYLGTTIVSSIFIVLSITYCTLYYLKKDFYKIIFKRKKKI